MRAPLFMLPLAAAALLRAQPSSISPAQAVQSALQHYPAVRVSQEQIQAAAAGITLARTAYLPRIDTLGQVNRATRNNVFGLLLPQSVIPSISGPVLNENNFGTVWGSALGALCGAIEDAFPDLDVRITELPLTPGRVWRAIQDARARRATTAAPSRNKEPR